MTESNLPVHPRTGLTAIGVVGGRPVFPILGADQRAEGAIMTRLAEIDTELATVRSELIAFADLPELDEAATTRFGELEVRLPELETEREPLQRQADLIARVRSQVAAGRGTEPVAGPQRGPEIMERVQPFADLGAVSRGEVLGQGLQSRALAALEQVDEYEMSESSRSKVEGLLRRQDQRGRIARHMLMTGSADYARAFAAVLSGTKEWRLDDDAQRALAFAEEERRRGATEGTDASGGYLVPFFVDPTLISTYDGTINPWRQVCTTKTITGPVWRGLTRGQASVEWLDETQEVGDHTPAGFGRPEIYVHRASSWIQSSFELMEDSNFASEIGLFLQEAKDIEESKQFALGDGVKKPKGVITALAANAGSVVNSITADTYAVGDVYALAAALRPRWRRNAKWVTTNETMIKTRQFATGSGPQHAFWADLGADTPPLLLGKPLYESSEMDATIDAGQDNLLAAYGDFASAYYIVDRIGMQVMYEPLVKGPNRRPTGEAGWFAFWRVGGDAVIPNAAKVLKV